MIRTKNLLIYTVILVLAACSEPEPRIVNMSGPTMGTMYQVKFVHDPSVQKALDKALIEGEIQQTLYEINQLMSTYIEDSELSHLNKAPANVPFPVNDEHALVIEEAIRLHQMTKGALDITVGPIVNLWGFGPELRPEKAPTDEELNLVRANVGIDKFRIENGSVTKLVDDLYIDLSTIAKGYAVDRLADLLEKHQINDYLVDIGGEMRVSGAKIAEQDWRLAIEKPSIKERSSQLTIVIGDNAIATSGDYRNYFEDNGVRYSHLINPNTGYPIQHNLVSVSVIAEKSMTADGLATGLIVLGKDEGLSVANDNNIAALFITKEGDNFVEYRSEQFDKLVTVLN